MYNDTSDIDPDYRLFPSAVIDYTRRHLVSHVFRRFLSQFSADFNEILQGLFSGHAATTVKFSLENIVQLKS